MGVVRYTVIDGEVIAEKRNGVRKLYVPDPLGSTVALIDNTQTITDTFNYWPYGEVNARTGTTPTPFQFVGTAGCYRDNASRTYVRARTLNTAQGRWMTKDPIGFEGGDWNALLYARNLPTSMVDSSGNKPNQKNNACQKFVASMKTMACSAFDNLSNMDRVRDCIMKEWDRKSDAEVQRMMTCLKGFLCSSAGKIRIIDCKDPSVCGTTISENCNPKGGGTIGICRRVCDKKSDCGHPPIIPCITIIHEAIHCCECSGHSSANTEIMAERLAACIAVTASNCASLGR